MPFGKREKASGEGTDTVPDVLLLHSALGLRPAVRAFAARVGALGFSVFTPDLYDGQLFADAEAGVAYMRWLGWDRLVARAESAAAEMADPFVASGMSLGAGLCAHLASTRPEVRGVLMLYSGEPPEGPWPRRVPVQVHHSVDDPWADVASSSALIASATERGRPRAFTCTRERDTSSTMPTCPTTTTLWQRP